MSIALTQAIETARQALIIQARVVAPAHWGSMVVVDVGGRLAVYNRNAWDKPDAAPLLPWRAPTGDVVGRVNLDGTYVPSDHS